MASQFRFGAGTPGWMAPEQIRFATPHIGAPTDLYALGCILFALLSDREPYVGSNEELLAQHRKQLEEQIADLQANLDEVKEHEKEARALLAKAEKMPHN